MPLLQLFLSFVFLISFFITLFIIAWYIALPLLGVWLILSGFYWIRMRYRLHTINRAMNGCTLRPTRQKTHTNSVIDVDYTEIDN